MRVVWFATSIFVLAIFFFYRELLIERKSFKLIFGISLALFVAAVLLSIFLRGTPTLFPSLMNPLVSLSLFSLMRKLFIRWKNREPLDTFFNWQRGLAADRLFNILYFALGFWISIFMYIGADLTGYKWH